MKKISRLIMAALTATAAITSCQQENILPETVNDTVQVKVSIGDRTKGFSDLDGITWEVGDQIKYAGGVELTSEPLTAEQISQDGYTASFTFAASLNEVDRTGWFCSTKCHPGNYNEVEFTLGNASGNVYTQDVAGEMNKRYLFLHSGTSIVSIKAGEAPTVKMDIAGTIFRVIPFTSKYNDESVVSVTLSSNTNFVGTVAYDRGAGTYKGVNTINWQAFNSVDVTLGTSFALKDASSAENGKGIYIAVAATEEGKDLDGYRYVVRTDKATYTFNAMDKKLSVGENAVKNVLLKLENADTRVDASSVVGDLQYVGELKDSYQLSYAAGTYPLSWWYAQIRDTGVDAWTTRENKTGTTQFYTNVKFSAIDDATGQEATWLKVGYRNGDTWWDATVEDNTVKATRSATVTATFVNVDGYALTDGMNTKVVKITQEPYNENKTLTFFGGIGDQVVESAAADVDLGYCVIDVNGVHAEDWAGDSHNEQELYGNVLIECRDGAANGPIVDWVTVSYGKDGSGKFNSTHLIASLSENTGAERKTLVCCTYTAPEGYVFSDGTTSQFKQFFLTQKAGVVTPPEDGDDEENGDTEGLAYTIYNNAADGSTGTGFGPAAASVGDWYRFENITIDGKTYLPGDEIKNLASDSELMGRLMAQAFEFGVLTESDVQIPGTDPLTTDPESFVTLEPWSDGGAAIYVRIVLSANDTGARRTFKIITKDASGAKVSTVVYFQNS